MLQFHVEKLELNKHAIVAQIGAQGIDLIEEVAEAVAVDATENAVGFAGGEDRDGGSSVGARVAKKISVKDVAWRPVVTGGLRAEWMRGTKIPVGLVVSDSNESLKHEARVGFMRRAREGVAARTPGVTVSHEGDD